MKTIIMKKQNFLLLFVLLFAFPFQSKAADISEEEIPILVKRIYSWSKDYPTVVNNWNGMLLDENTEDYPPILSIITNINGVSTKGMTEQEFNTELMSSSNCQLNYKIKDSGKFVEKTCNLSYNKSLLWQSGLNREWPEPFPNNVSIETDNRKEFFKYTKFDYKFNESPDINEENVLDLMGQELLAQGMIRDSIAPEIIVSMDLQKDEDGITCYIIITENDKEKSLGNKPIWKLKYSGLFGNLDDIESSICQNIGDYCENYPFAEPVYCHKVLTLGVAFSNYEDMQYGRVARVLPGCDAYSKGLRAGDQIKKAYYGGAFDVFSGTSRRCWFRAGRKHGKKVLGFSYIFFIPLIPNTTTNDVENYLSIYYYGDSFRKNHLIVRKANGQKVDMKMPMSQQEYTFKYLR